MITNNGKLIIKRFHAHQVGQIGGALAFGVGTSAPNVNNTTLEYEIFRSTIKSVNVDPNGDSIVFRCTLPPGQISRIYEVGLWSSSVVSQNYTFGVLGISPTAWTNGTLTATNARANSNALQINYVASGTTNAELSGFNVDLSAYTDNDSLVVGYHATTNLSSTRIRLGIDSSNYYEFLLPAPVANAYNVARVARASASKVGNPDWARVQYIAVRPSASAAGGGSIFFDGVRIESNGIYESNLLVARSVLGTPHIVDPNISSDIEYSLRVAIA